MLLRTITFLTCFGFISLSWGATAQDHYASGNDYFKQNQWDNAIEQYQKAAQLDPQSWETYMALGSAYIKTGKKAEALDAFNKSLSLYPDNTYLAKFAARLKKKLTAQGVAVKPAIEKTATVAEKPSAVSTTAPAAPLNGLPKPGDLVFNVGFAGWLSSFQDLNDQYGTAVNSDSIPYGGEFGLGLDYTLSPNFQLGLQAQGLVKIPEQIQYTGVFGAETDQWNEYAVGGALVLKALFSLGGKTNLILNVQGGYYTLVASTVLVTIPSGSNTLNLTVSNIGGCASAEIELVQGSNNSWALDFGVGYRYLPMTPVAARVAGDAASPSVNLLKAAGGNATLDFSGPRLNVAARFF
jgi:hypothetical protein